MHWTPLNFNLGAVALQRATLGWKVNSGEHERGPIEPMPWIWAGGQKLPGLVQRRQAEELSYAEIFLNAGEKQ